MIDSSALIAVSLDEPDAAIYARALAESAQTRISAVTVFEASMVLSRHRRDAFVELRAFLDRLETTVEPFTGIDASLAFDAFRRFGRGSGHPARLNFGDCASYALAMRLGAPLIFKGADFAQTDVIPAVTPPPAP